MTPYTRRSWASKDSSTFYPHPNLTCCRSWLAAAVNVSDDKGRKAQSREDERRERENSNNLKIISILYDSLNCHFLCFSTILIDWLCCRCLAAVASCRLIFPSLAMMIKLSTRDDDDSANDRETFSHSSKKGKFYIAPRHKRAAAEPVRYGEKWKMSVPLLLIVLAWS